MGLHHWMKDGSITPSWSIISSSSLGQAAGLLEPSRRTVSLDVHSSAQSGAPPSHRLGKYCLLSSTALISNAGTSGCDCNSCHFTSSACWHGRPDVSCSGWACGLHMSPVPSSRLQCRAPGISPAVRAGQQQQDPVTRLETVSTSWLVMSCLFPNLGFQEILLSHSSCHCQLLPYFQGVGQ